MNGINIDSTTNRLSINPNGIDVTRFEVPQQITTAQEPSQFEYVEPVEFGEGRFGNPAAFERLQEILKERALSDSETKDESIVEEPVSDVQAVNVGLGAPEFSC